MFANIGKRISLRLKRLYWWRAGLGPGSLIELSANMSNPRHVSLGEHSYISHNVVITNDFGHVTLGDRSHLAPGCVVNCYKGNLTCGNDVAVGPGTCLICHSNAYKPNVKITEATTSEDITIGDNVLLGANVTVLPGVKIGSNSIVAAGAVVTDDVAPNAIVGGVPATRIKERIFGQDVTCEEV